MWHLDDPEESEFGGDEDLGFRPDPPPLSTHCNVPLKYNKQRAAIGKPSFGQYVSPSNQYRREFFMIQEVSGKTKPTYYDLCHVQDFLLNNFVPPSNTSVMAEFEQQSRVSSQLWKIQSLSLQSMASEGLIFPDYNLNDHQMKLLQTYYLRKAFYEEVVLSTGSNHFKPNLWWTKHHEISVFRSFDLLMIGTKNLLYIEQSGSSYLVSRDHLLILSDLAAQRYVLLKYAFCAELHPQKPFLPSGMLLEFFEIGDKILFYGGNEAYEVISKVEPLCISYLVGDLPVGKPTGSTFRELIINEILAKCEELHIATTIKSLIALLDIAFQQSPAYITELYGLYRIWGHPTLEPLEGTSALKKIATPIRITKMNYVDKITNKFKEEFICRYISKEHIWPDLDLSRLPDSNVIKQAYEKKSSFPNKHRNYRRSDLKLVTFNKIFPIDPKFDLIELIADKALSLITPDLIYHIRSKQNCGDSIERSVLLNWLKSPIQDPELFLNHIDKHGFPNVEQSNGVREKEREEKLKPRMFGLMTLFKRMYIVLTEALLAEHILPYFPEITMIDDELSLDKKRYTFNTKLGQRDHVIISLDFAKWNSNMRKNETLPLFECFDKLFGFKNCFTRTHEMFESSSMYLLNGTYLPGFDELGNLTPDIGCWYGHLGGIEGLRQKGWTVWTAILILLAAEGLDFIMSLMGQGDNQIIKLVFALGLAKDACDKLLYQFLFNLNNILSHIGPPLKLEETWASRSLFVYGKYIIHNGIPLPTSGKRICRIFRLSNEDYPTLESSLSSATANLTSAIGSHHCIGPLFYIYLGEIIGILQLYIRSSYLQPIPMNQVYSKLSQIKIPGNPTIIKDVIPKLRNQFLQQDDLYTEICLFPRSLGGFPIMNIFNCLVRGFPDEVSFDLASLKIFHLFSDSNLQKIIARFCSPPILNSKNFQLLSEHPTVLNLEIPPAPSESRRNLIIGFLKSGDVTINPYVKIFLDLLDSDEDTKILEVLENIHPFNPRVISLFMDATTEARARHVAGKLQKTKTVANLARSLSSVDLYSKIADAEKNHFGSILRLISQDHPNTITWNPSQCSVTHADALRKLSWGKDVIGVNCVPPQEFVFLESDPIKALTSTHYESSKGYVTLRYDQNYKDPTFVSPLTRGNFVPYRGSVTRQKVSGYGDKIASQADPVIQKVLRLFSLVGWGIPKNGNLHNLAINLLKRHTDLHHEELCPPDEEISGSVHHRLQDMRTGHGGSVPSLPNYGTKFMFDTFPLVAYSKGSKNVNLMFQSFMSFSVMVEGERLSHGNRPEHPTLYLVVKDSCCVQVIQDDLCEIPFSPPMLSSYPSDNPYLFVPKQKLLILIEKGIRFPIYRELSQDIDQIFLRFHSILAEECFHLLSPHSWDKPTLGFKTQQLVINWILPVNIGLLLHNIALRLCAHYTGALRESSHIEFIDRVAERVERSPVEHWKSLLALIFAQNIHHHLTGPMVFSKISGNPICGENSFAVMLKEGIVNILRIWSHSPESLDSLNYIDVYGRPYCGLSQHPSLILITKSWFLREISTAVFITLRYALIEKITSKQSGSFSDEIKQKIDHFYGYGVRRISGESLDYLCKKDFKKYETIYHTNETSHSLPSSGESIVSFNQENLILGQLEIHQEEISTSHIYLNHVFKLASLPTTGTYKCLSILKEVNLNDPDYIACLGDGAGGFTLGALLYFEDAKVFYNTLITKESPIQQSSPIPFIPALAGHPHLEQRIIGQYITTDVISDITEPNFHKIIRTLLNHSFKLTMCDAETIGDGFVFMGRQLFIGALKFAIFNSSDIFVFKTYLANISLITFQISLGLTCYKNVKLFRSEFSTVGNTEIYLIFENPSLKHSLRKSSETQWNGHILNDSAINLLYQWRSYLLNPEMKNIQVVAKMYTEVIAKESTNLLTELIRHLPFVSVNTSITYPTTIANWILNTSSKIVGTPDISRVRLETTTLHHSYIKRWILAYLVSLCLSNVSLWLLNLGDLIKNGCFIWFRLKNKTWDTSICRGSIPLKQDRSFRVYALKEFITSTELKIIHRLIGLCLHFNISSNNINSNDSELRGPKYISKDLILDPPNHAENLWIYINIQCGTSLKAKPRQTKPSMKPSRYTERHPKNSEQ